MTVQIVKHWKNLDQIFPGWKKNKSFQYPITDIAFKHLKKNKKILKTVEGVSELNDYWKDKPAIIVSAGPSLNKNINELKRKKLNLVAIDVALPPLLERNIIPKFIVTVEPSPNNCECWANKPELKNSILIAPSWLNPESHNKFLGKTYFYNIWGADSWRKAFLKYAKDYGNVQLGGGVGHTALYFAYAYLNSNPLILVGFDHCYTENYFADNGLEKWANTNGKRAIIDPNNKRVFTTSYLYHYKRFIERFIDDMSLTIDKTIVNATEGGILGYNDREFNQNLTYMTLKEAIKRNY